jgi:hypothetical protein
MIMTPRKRRHSFHEASGRVIFCTTNPRKQTIEIPRPSEIKVMAVKKFSRPGFRAKAIDPSRAVTRNKKRQDSLCGHDNEFVRGWTRAAVVDSNSDLVAGFSLDEVVGGG